jgi:hypothetical protein
MLNQFNHWHLQHLIRPRIAKAFLHFLSLRLCVRFLKSVNWQIKDAEMSVKLLYLLSLVCVLLWPKIEKSRKQNACGLFGPYTYITNSGVCPGLWISILNHQSRLDQIFHSDRRRTRLPLRWCPHNYSFTL